MPGHLHAAENALGVWHEDGAAPVGGSQAGNALLRAVGVAGIILADPTGIIDKARPDGKLSEGAFKNFSFVDSSIPFM